MGPEQGRQLNPVVPSSAVPSVPHCPKLSLETSLPQASSLGRWLALTGQDPWAWPGAGRCSEGLREAELGLRDGQ